MIDIIFIVISVMYDIDKVWIGVWYGGFDGKIVFGFKMKCGFFC